jgi:hypothetical protein
MLFSIGCVEWFQASRQFQASRRPADQTGAFQVPDVRATADLQLLDFT